MGDDLVEGMIGGPCAFCDNILYYKDQTPKYVEVILADIVGCFWYLPFPEMPSGKFILKQSLHSNCFWSVRGPKFRVDYQVLFGGSNLWAYVWAKPATGAPIEAWQRCFLGMVPSPCATYFTNSYICDDYRNFGHDGEARVFIPTGQNIAYFLAVLLGIEKYLDMKSEHWWYDFSLANICVVRLARQADHTNVLVKWDRSHYDQDIMTES